MLPFAIKIYRKCGIVNIKIHYIPYCIYTLLGVDYLVLALLKVCKLDELLHVTEYKKDTGKRVPELAYRIVLPTPKTRAVQKFRTETINKVFAVDRFVFCFLA